MTSAFFYIACDEIGVQGKREKNKSKPPLTSTQTLNELYKNWFLTRKKYDRINFFVLLLCVFQRKSINQLAASRIQRNKEMKRYLQPHRHVIHIEGHPILVFLLFLNLKRKKERGIIIWMWTGVTGYTSSSNSINYTRTSFNLSVLSAASRFLYFFFYIRLISRSFCGPSPALKTHQSG